MDTRVLLGLLGYSTGAAEKRPMGPAWPLDMCCSREAGTAQQPQAWARGCWNKGRQQKPYLPPGPVERTSGWIKPTQLSE